MTCSCLRLSGIRCFSKHFFIEQPGKKPQRRVIEPDYAVDLQWGAAVVPGTAVPFFQVHPGGIFDGKDAEHIDEASGYGSEFFQQG